MRALFSRLHGRLSMGTGAPRPWLPGADGVTWRSRPRSDPRSGFSSVPASAVGGLGVAQPQLMN